MQKVGEGKRVKVRVHVDRLGVYNHLMEMDTWPKVKPSADVDDKKGWLAGWLAGNRLFIQKQRRGY